MPVATVAAPRRRRGVRACAGTVLTATAAMTLAGPGAVPARAAGPASADGALEDASWWWTAMGVDELHRAGTGRGVTVALIDTPINPAVPELKGKVADSSSPCLLDDAGRTESPSSTTRAAEHGTSMAALIAGTGHGNAAGGAGIRGIAPDARLLHYAVVYRDTPDADRVRCGIRAPRFEELEDAVARSIRRAVDDGARIINLSLTSGYDADYGPALLHAYRAGAIVVAGTSNRRRDVLWPAMGNGVVVVNPVDRRGRVYDDSVRSADTIAFAAPGKGVNSFGWDGGAWRSDYRSDGSSNATALVSGGLAAMWSAHPDATGNQVLQAARAGVGLRRSGDTVQTWFRREGAGLPKVTQPNPAYGWGIFDPADAVRTDPTTLPDENPFLRDEPGAEPSAQQVRALPAGVTPSGASTASAASPASPAPTTTDAAPLTRAADRSGPGWGAVALGAGVVAVLGGLGAALARRRAGASSTGGDPDDTGTSGAVGARHGVSAEGED